MKFGVEVVRIVHRFKLSNYILSVFVPRYNPKVHGIWLIIKVLWGIMFSSCKVVTEK